MPDPQVPGDLPPSKTTQDMLREARNAVSGGGSGATASEDLLADARSWLGAQTTDTEMPSSDTPYSEMPDAPEPDTAEDAEERYVEALDERLDEEIAPRRRARRTARPLPTPPGPLDSDRAERARRRMAGLVAAIALAGVLVAAAIMVFAADTSNDTTPVDAVVVQSSGSVTSASDPCTGASISGDLDTTISYLPDPDAPTVEIWIDGDLVGSDGSTYNLRMHGMGEGTAGQTAFTFHSDSMVMTRNDGLEFEDDATVTVLVEGGQPTEWSYETAGADCPG